MHIEYFIVIIFFMLIIPFWRMLNRPVKVSESTGEAFRAINLQSLRIPQGLLFNKNHTWTHLERSGV